MMSLTKKLVNRIVIPQVAKDLEVMEMDWKTMAFSSQPNQFFLVE